MLARTMAGPCPRLALLVHHTDRCRDWARRDGWLVLDLARDWAVVHPLTAQPLPIAPLLSLP